MGRLLSGKGQVVGQEGGRREEEKDNEIAELEGKGFFYCVFPKDLANLCCGCLASLVASV